MSRERCICSLGEESESRAEGGPASRSFAPVFPLPPFLSCTSSGPADETTPGSGSLTWAEFKREERRPAELRVHRFFSLCGKREFASVVCCRLKTRTKRRLHGCVPCSCVHGNESPSRISNSLIDVPVLPVFRAAIFSLLRTADCVHTHS